MKINIDIPRELNRALYEEVDELREKGVKTSKAKLILKYLEIGFKQERV